MLDLRTSRQTPTMERWLKTPQLMHCIGWAWVDPPVFYTKMAVKQGYDGMIFIESTSATTPTKYAIKGRFGADRRVLVNRSIFLHSQGGNDGRR